MDYTIRPARAADIPGIKSVTKDADLFPPHMLDAMIAGYMGQANGDIWFVSVADGQVVGFGFCEPERMTSGTWNLLAIGILTGYRRRGLGRWMVRYLEDRLRFHGQRILIVETMGTAEFRPTRAFYNAIGYAEEARIREFYGAGADKIVYWKRL